MVVPFENFVKYDSNKILHDAICLVDQFKHVFYLTKSVWPLTRHSFPLDESLQVLYLPEHQQTATFALLFTHPDLAQIYKLKIRRTKD